MFAVLCRLVDLVPILSAFGSDLRQTCSSGMTLLHRFNLLQTNALPMAKLLIERVVEIDNNDSNGRTALQMIIQESKTSKSWSNWGASASHELNGKRALHLAAEAGKAVVCKLVIERGDGVNSLSSDKGRTPLHWANSSNSMDRDAVIELLHQE